MGGAGSRANLNAELSESIVARVKEKFSRFAYPRFIEYVNVLFAIMPLGLGYAIVGTSVLGALVAGFGTPLAPAVYLMAMAAVSAAVVIFFFRETKGLSLSRTTVL